eukprot:350820-Chlamydomonas_euryale.AAC.2
MPKAGTKVHTSTRMHAGETFSGICLGIRIAMASEGLGGSSDSGGGGGGAADVGDVLPTWVALVMLTLDELGVEPPHPAGGAGAGVAAAAPRRLPRPDEGVSEEQSRFLQVWGAEDNTRADLSVLERSFGRGRGALVDHMGSDMQL